MRAATLVRFGGALKSSTSPHTNIRFDQIVFNMSAAVSSKKFRVDSHPRMLHDTPPARVYRCIIL